MRIIGFEGKPPTEHYKKVDSRITLEDVEKLRRRLKKGVHGSQLILPLSLIKDDWRP